MLHNLDKKEYEVLHIENPFLNINENPEDKLGILDVKIRTANNKTIDIELQMAKIRYMRERILYYVSKMV